MDDYELEDCCFEPELCYQHLVMGGYTSKEALEIIKEREKKVKVDLTPILKEPK